MSYFLTYFFEDSERRHEVESLRALYLEEHCNRLWQWAWNRNVLLEGEDQGFTYSQCLTFEKIRIILKSQNYSLKSLIHRLFFWSWFLFVFVGVWYLLAVALREYSSWSILSQTSVSDSSLLGTPFRLSHLSIQISLPPVMRESLNLRGEGHFSSYGIHPPTNGKSSLQHCSQVIIWFLMKTHSDGYTTVFILN